MRLSKIKVFGYGRLGQGSLDVSGRVLAVVGPNEAGKSTLLEALEYLTSDKTLPVPRRTRTREVDDSTTVVSGIYIIDSGDKDRFAALDLESIPEAVTLSRHAGDSTWYFDIRPKPARSVRNLRVIAKKLLRSLKTKDINLPLEPSEALDEGTLVTVRDRTERVLAELSDELSSDDPVGRITASVDNLRDLRSELQLYSHDEGALSTLQDLIDWADRSDAFTETASIIRSLVPKALLFTEADRSIPSTISLDNNVVENLPRGVGNLIDLAELDLHALWRDIDQGHRAGKETKIAKANSILQEKFKSAWKQSDLTVRLDIEQSILNIDVVQNGESITPFDERSAGLKMYAALTAFLARQDLTAKSILLVDEAETHLHIDAQADLVSAFMSQDTVAKIIYTTHSPACLPPDLGTGVRAVIPSETNHLESTLENSFWRNATGFTPLMIAMGAGAAAFSTARYVVLGEGSTEMLLLPSLIKAATNLSELQYQIAPGLSEAAPETYDGLDLEGAHVAFLVDGDEGGASLRASLERAKVSKSKIITLGVTTLEHLLNPDGYRSAYVRVLKEWNPGVRIGEPPAFAQSDDPWPTQLATWARAQRGLIVPGKRDVASSIVECGEAIPSTANVAVLKKLHRDIEKALRIPKGL